MRNSSSMGTRIRLSIYTRGTNWDCLSKLFDRRSPSRYILRSSPLPLCVINGGRICHFCWFLPLIPTIYRIQPPPSLREGSFLHNVRRGQSNILSPTLPRVSRNATTVLRLPGRLYTLKHSFFHRLHHFIGCNASISFSNLRSICLTARMYSPRVCSRVIRMTICLFSSLPPHV